MDDLRGIARLRRALQRRELSARELARLALERLGSQGVADRAVAELTPEIAQREARVADRRLRDGTAGPLTGIPYGVKDLLAVRGTRTTWGAEPYRDQVFDHDAGIVERLRDAGAVLVSKLAMLSLAGAGGVGSTGASLQGATRNPWDRRYWAGGSSTGPGAAVAAGLVPFAIGSETTGSVLIPAAFCGVTGFRPSFGIVTRYGCMPLAWSFDKLGPLAESAAECVEILRAVAGRDERDETTDAWTYRRPAQRTIRAGVLPFERERYPETAAVFDEALRDLRRAGHRLRDVALPDRDHRRVAKTIQDVETASALASLIESPALEELGDAPQRERLRAVPHVTGVAYVRATQERARIVRDLDDVLRTVDVIVTPTLPMSAWPIDEDLSTWGSHLHWGVLGALAGLPAVSVPMGFTPDGLPLGLCFIGRRREDALLLNAAQRYQRQTDWHRRQPSRGS